MVGVGTRGAVWALGGAYAPPHGAGHNSFLDVLGGGPGGPPLDGASLTVALDVVQAWAVLITVGFTLVLFVFLAFCVCAKKDDGYDEYELTQGITTVKVCHDGGENGLGSYPRINGSNTPGGTDEASEASSRCTLKRELPAIPLSAQPDPSAIECNVERTQSQHSSDLYAAVGDGNDAGVSGIGKVIGGVQVLPAGAIGPDGRAAIIRDPAHTSPTDPSAPPHVDGTGVSAGSGIGTAAHPYAKVKKNHPYAHVKLPKKDHPYAKVVRDDSEDPETDTDNYDDPKAITKDKSSRWDSEGGYEPAPPIPEKRFDLEEESTTGTAPPDSGLMTTSVTSSSSAKGPSSPRSPHLNTRSSMSGSAPSPTSPHSIGTVSDRPPSSEIQAALAISGQTPANEEMPYMTPPLHHTEEAGIEISSQQNFSGDSQDSRGYTSISVREPLAALKAQTQGTAAPQLSSATQPLEGEGYYMTVSDDSADEMYACIYEGTRGVGSETYAQIEPRSTPPPPPPMPSPPHGPSTPSPLSTRGGSQPPPAPPSVDSLRHVVHSRQASSSSAASTVMGSPGAEKRGTRSPLPPLPQGDTSLYSGPSPQPPHSPPRSVPPIERPTQRALEEMYAKVMKKQRPGHARGDSSGGGGDSDAGSVSSSRRGSVDIGSARWGSHASSPPTTPRQSVDLGAMTRSLVETRNHEVVASISRAKSYEKTGVWGNTTQHPQPTLPNPNYETIPQLPTNFYSGGSSDPGYETVKNSEPPYASVERPDENYPGYETVKQTSDLDSEPGYETLKHREYEPGYETVTGEAKLESSEPGYETVAHEKNHDDDEPGYETVTHRRAGATDPGYETVKGKTVSEFGDPGYEELQGAIHHARTTSEHDPNYEQLKFSSRRSSDGDAEPGYEVVKKVDPESTYEFVCDYDTQENYPPYEKINKPGKDFSKQETPMYASVRKGSKSPEKKLAEERSPEEYRNSRAIGLLESNLDNYPPPISYKDSKEASIMKDSDEEKHLKLSLTKSDQQPLPSEKKSPVKSPDKGSPSVKSPYGLPPVTQSLKGSPPVMKSPKGSPPMTKSPKGSPPLMKSPKGSPPIVKSPDKVSPTVLKSPKGSPPEKGMDKGYPPVTESPKESPPLTKSPNKGSVPVMKSPKGSPPLMPSPDKETPPLMKSPSPDLESPKGSPPLTKSSDKGSPPLMKSPKEFSPMMPIPDRETPPLMKSPSPDLEIPFMMKSPKGSPPVLQSPDKESPPLMKSPSPDIESPRVMKSPKGSPPVMHSPGKETPPLMKSPSPDLESPPMKKSEKGSPPAVQSPDRETPPMMKSPSPDIEFPPKVKSLDIESSTLVKSQDQEINSSKTINSVWQSAAPEVTLSEMPSSNISSTFAAPSSPPLVVSSGPKTSVFISSPDVGFHLDQEESYDKLTYQAETKCLVHPPSPPHLEEPVTEQPASLPESQPPQQQTQSPVKAYQIEGSVCEQASSAVNVNVEELTPTLLEGAGPMPPQPGVTSPEREASPVAFSSLGSEDLPAPLSLEETEDQPQETVNPLFMLDNDIQQQIIPVTHDISTTEHDTSIAPCSDLPPPPPPVMDEYDNAFTNDFPPPLPESSPLMPRTSTLCEDTPPPPLVPPSDVEGLDELLNLANMGSSSSGSTAGQPGSIHESSEKDSDSPQESDVVQIEGAVTVDELPPPPPLSEPSEPGTERDSDEELDNSVSSGYECGFTAGGITVTVNPMAVMEEKPDSPVHVPPPPPPPPPLPPPPSETTQAAPPSPIVAAAIVTSSAGSQSSSSGSGSQDTGSGSVESVVTVECAPTDGGIHGRQPSTDSSSSPESHHLDPHEQITEV